MGLYARHIGPRLVGCLCALAPIAEERKKVVPEASGVVLEIGIGPGLNLEFYDPARVERVIGVDPGLDFTKLGTERFAASPVPLELIHAPAEGLPLDDGTIDTCVLTYTLCSVRDPKAVLAELKRVLKPGGRLLFLEHGLSHEANIAAWQNRVNPIWTRLAVGCNLNRPVLASLDAAGFAVSESAQYYLDGAPRIVGYQSRGIAVSA